MRKNVAPSVVRNKGIIHIPSKEMPLSKRHEMGKPVEPACPMKPGAC
jgi:hypothetical protein